MVVNKYGETHIPMKITWEVTERCNLNCKMCYSIDCNSKKNIVNELSTKEAKNLMDILEANEVLYLFLEGGEPLLRSDFFEILYISASKFCTWVSTNGTLIGSEEAREIKKSKANTIFVSLHGHSEKIHDSITQKTGSFYKTVNGIEELIRQNVSVMTTFQISRLNFGYISDYVKLCKELHIPKINFLRPYPLGNGKTNYNKFALTANEYKQITKELEARCKENNILFGHSFGIKNHNCCKQAFSIDSTGNLMNCPYLRFLPRLGNIFKNNLIDIWNSEDSQKIRNSYKYFGNDCTSCAIKNKCSGGCLSSKLLDTGKVETKDPICWL
ncbi:radical SAM/SPASM domain-containing protein [Clostridium felsineum]|uniref:radical SAM/SPASM domain-containing protein n=1 Tax=Clostridium felsineum TaxID=36839 RepID=UPI00098C3AFE|nr:radical SAM protein [Clostridium felsineum]URZ14074.1 Putative mycofactocin radical SAM maturase MftC [Clostridium felsineum DSM 794]